MAMYNGYVSLTIYYKHDSSESKKVNFRKVRKIERKKMYTKSGLRFSGLAFCVELWTKQVSYRILVQMSYISKNKMRKTTKREDESSSGKLIVKKTKTKSQENIY